jgi:hypothetical protein
MRVDEIISYNHASAPLAEAAVEVPSLEEGFEEAAKIICRDCSKWLRESGGTLFYRGVNLDKFSRDPSSFKRTPIVKLTSGELGYLGDEMMVRVSVPRNRKPSDSPQWLHDVMDENLVKNTGIPFRSRSIFAVGNYTVASDYGAPYAIFPIGDFDYAWSKVMDDPAYTFYLSVLESGFGNILYHDGGAVDAIRRYWSRAVAKMDEAGEFDSNPAEYSPTVDSYLRVALSTGGAIDIKRGSERSLYVKIIKDFIKNTKLWTFNRDLKMAASGSDYSSHEVMVSSKYCYAVSCGGDAHHFYDFKRLLKYQMKKANIS